MTIELNTYAKLQNATEATFKSFTNPFELAHFAQEVRIRSDRVISGKLSLTEAIAQLNALRVIWDGVR